MTSAPALTITIYLTNRSVHVYGQDSEEVARRSLGRIELDRIFTDPTWTIGGHHHVSTFLTRQILRVEFASPYLPKWPFGSSIDDLCLVTLDEFETRANEVRKIERAELRLADGAPYEALAVLEDICGGRTPLRAWGKVVPRAVRAKRLSHFLEGPCLHVRKADNVSILFNTANLAGVFSYPGPPELPTQAMEASTRLRSNSE